MSLNYQDVQQLLKLLDDSPYDELELDTGSFSLQLKRGADGNWQQRSLESRTPVRIEFDVAADTSTTEHTAAAPESAADESGLLEVRAPMVGTWYRAPKPGAEPFISVGDRVAPDTVIGIIEVMKLMSSIPAGVSGSVTEILAEDAGFVEKGQLLLRVRPE